jgi:hypothetical protein
MSVLFDYFAASSDDAAASAIGLAGGPGTPVATPAAGDRDAARVAAAGAAGEAGERAPFDTLSVKGIDPLVQLGTLEALLTGREYELIVAGQRAGHALAVEDDGERVVVTLTDELQASLADADDARLAAAAGPWSQTDEFFGSADPRDAADFLQQLAALARRARDRDERLYCWICV